MGDASDATEIVLPRRKNDLDSESCQLCGEVEESMTSTISIIAALGEIALAAAGLAFTGAILAPVFIG
jgi:hypothetical protein